MKKFFKKGDAIIILVAAFICALLFLPRVFSKSRKPVAIVYENGVVTHEIALSDVKKSYELEINGAVLFVENGAVSYKEADCPDKTCVKSGRLSEIGDTAACVPNKTVVTVIGEKNNSPDVITY